jgi:hypothetical protein
LHGASRDHRHARRSADMLERMILSGFDEGRANTDENGQNSQNDLKQSGRNAH